MARGAAQAQRKRAQAAQPKRRQKGASWEDELFFSRLRRHTKPVFVLLALVFAAGFVVLGVGSGSSGVADVLSNLFHSSTGTSINSQIKSDQKKIAAHPRNTEPYLDLATLYQQKQDQAAALATLQSALKVKPKDLDVLSRIASIYQSQAETARNNAADAQTALAAANTAPPGVDVSSSLGQAFTADPLSQELKTRATDAFSKVSPAFTKAEDGYRRLAIAARGTSEEANAQLQLASIAKDTLQVTGQPSHALVALAAYKRYLKLEPKGVQATLAKQTITQLQAFLPKKKQ
jgi:cytochrome c-type biogenesis protein CcmH/NrfG